MKKFEEKLENLSVPKLGSDPFEQVLKAQLKGRYFSPTRKAQTQLRWAIGFAMLFFVVAIGLIIKPQFALRAHNFTFQTSGETAVQPEDWMQLNDGLRYTTIHNPSIGTEFNPDNYIEDKAYVVRKYRSQKTNDALLIVSEFTSQPIQLASNTLF